MSASATYTTLYTFRLDRRQLVRRIRVDITGLASGANTIPHGIVAPNNQAVGRHQGRDRPAHLKRGRTSHPGGGLDQSLLHGRFGKRDDHQCVRHGVEEHPCSFVIRPSPGASRDEWQRTKDKGRMTKD